MIGVKTVVSTAFREVLEVQTDFNPGIFTTKNSVIYFFQQCHLSLLI